MTGSSPGGVTVATSVPARTRTGSGTGVESRNVRSATAAEGGAMVAGAPPEQVEAMRVYGLHLGIAFQIVDDILDFTGDPAVMGKPVGSDLAGGTLTLPTILYMQRKPDDNPVKRA